LADENRYTFSSITSILIDNHLRLKQLYDALAIESAQPDLKAQLIEFSKTVSKQVDGIRRARMNSVEISLEPIDDLQLGDLLARLHVVTNAESPLERLINVERILSELYSQCAPRIERMSAEGSQLFSDLSQGCVERANWLSHITERSDLRLQE
jgi:hypothetical protein